jgi:ATP-dependent DNA helicase DinG
MTDTYTSLALVPEPITYVQDPSDACWGTPGFPTFVKEFRDEQWNAFVAITNAFASGADVVLLDAPVGSGKTVIAEMVDKWMRTPALYVCSGKALQDQFARDFTYAKVLKGRSNYPTFDNPHDSTVTAADCDSSREFLPACSNCPGDSEGVDTDNDDDRVPHCSECHPIEACPYRVAKRNAILSRLACINTSYLLTEANGPGGFSKRGFVIVDECDMLEKELMSYFEVTISSRRRQQYDIPYPDHKTVVAGTRERETDDGEVYTAWEEWFTNTIALVKRQLAKLPHRPESRQQRKEVTYLARLAESLNMVKGSIANGDWVYTGYEKGDITFKPVRVSEFGHQVLWQHGEKWLLMSGTIIDPVEMVESLGLPPEKHWEVVTVPMTFPKENRPIKILPTAMMTAKTKEEAWPKMAKRVREIADHHPDERILVHAVSYELSKFISAHLPPERLVTYTNAQDREPALQRYLDKPASILVAPSMDRGVDLPGDACRVQVICKLPFPYLGDKQVSSRLYSKGGQQWYLIQCIRSFVQMTGRGVRNDEDYAITYILDKAFQDNIWKKAKRLLPKYLVDAIDWSGRL